MPDNIAHTNAFRAEWELLLRHVAGDRPQFPRDLRAGARGVQLAEAGLRCWRERRWIHSENIESVV